MWQPWRNLWGGRSITCHHLLSIETRRTMADVYMAKLAEQAERYEEMVEHMKKVAQEKSVERGYDFFGFIYSKPRVRCG